MASRQTTCNRDLFISGGAWVTMHPFSSRGASPQSSQGTPSFVDAVILKSTMDTSLCVTFHIRKGTNPKVYINVSVLITHNAIAVARRSLEIP